MRNKSFCNRAWQLPATKRTIGRALCFALAGMLLCAPVASANDAPAWMHALVSAPLPPHDEKTDAVLLYSEKNVAIVSADKMKIHVREAYKILRPSGREYGTALVYFRSPEEKVTSLHGWCIPAQGKDYEVKDKDAMEEAPPKIDGGELMSDIKVKILRIPASDPGNIVGYEYEIEKRPLVLQDSWEFQEEAPARESRYSLQLPADWEYKTAWLNHSDVTPSQGGNQSQWSLTDIPGIRREEEMPPMEGVAGEMVVTFFPAGGGGRNALANWRDVGQWYGELTTGRRDASPQIKQEVIALTSSKPVLLDKMRALAQFVQHDVRYVAIELGIGGYQPHPAADVFSHRYGDCKDKATLMSSMLAEIGVDSYYVVINHERGAVTHDMPAHVNGFDHVILAIKLPDAVASGPRMVATLEHPKLGTLLFFDPTNELVPLGQIPGYLQANYGLLVTPSGGELLELPVQPATMNSVRRIARLSLDQNGTLKGEVKETRFGDRASSERRELHALTKDTDRIKLIETALADSVSSFLITQASIVNLDLTDQPFGFNYSFSAENYAHNAGDLLLVRPRVLGTKASGILETPEPRNFPIEFRSPLRDEDSFEITLPPGYSVDELPPPVDADYSFATYHSKSEVSGNVIRYTRTFEVKQLSVPLSKAEDLKTFYRIIATDERNTAVLKPTTK